MLGAERLYEERTVKPSNINNRGYEQACTLGLLWLGNDDPDGVAQQKERLAQQLGHSAECIYYCPFIRRSFDPRFL